MHRYLMYSVFIVLLLVALECFGCNCGDSGPLASTDPFDALGPWHQRHLDCGIPPFAYRLPQNAQEKIHSIWLNYKAGDECEKEQEQTRAVIMEIPEETRVQLFKGVCGPGFLKNESNDIRASFMDVWFDDDLSIEQKQIEFRKLAQHMLKNDESINRFTKFDQKLSENIAARNQTIQHLSSGARDAYNNWVGLRKKEHKFLASLSPEIRAELGLICKCCGTCKTGQKHNSSSTIKTNRARRFAENNMRNLAEWLNKEDKIILNDASNIECSY